MPPRLLLFLCIVAQVYATVFNDETEACREDEEYGRKSFVCDLNGRLASNTRRKLSNILEGLQLRIGCECEDGCTRADGNDNFIGLLHVTSSKSTDDLERDMKKEYEDLSLGNSSCDHGLVLVYLKDTQQLATYRGENSYVLLVDEDMQKLHSVASQQGADSDTLALQYLLTNYKQVSESPIQSTPWLPVAGMIVAVLLVLCLMSVLLSLLCAKCFCCCAKNKKDVYHIQKPATYKTIEPLYVITPPSTHNPRMGDAIYSTPYSGSPMPFPPPPGATMPVTPTSTYRHRVDRNGKKDTISRSEIDSLGGHGEYEPRHAVMPFHAPLSPLDPAYGTIPRARLGQPPTTTSPAPSSPRDAGDLQFLDPRRKQEIQTREELIY